MKNNVPDKYIFNFDNGFNYNDNHTSRKSFKIDKKVSYISSKTLLVSEVEEVFTEVKAENKIENEIEDNNSISSPKEKVILPEEKIIESEIKEEQLSNLEIKKQEDTNSTQALVGDKFTGNMSCYGADIGSYTAFGYSIENTITYIDKTYGEVRILASGREYPFGTIVKVTNSKIGNFIGIVLDRGGDIGRGEGKKFAFDVLLESSKEAYKNGVSYQTNFEIERVGF